MYKLLALALFIATPASTEVHVTIHAGIKASVADPGYTYGYGATITLGRKPARSQLVDRPIIYNYNVRCPYNTKITFNKSTQQWYCVYF